MSNNVPWYRRSLVPALAAQQERKAADKLVKAGKLCPHCGSRRVKNIGRNGKHWFFFGVFALLKSKRARCLDCAAEWGP